MTPAVALAPSDPCPCTSGRRYGDCCAPLLAGAAASSPEALMRSRYTAFALRDAEYLRATWHSRTRPARIELDEHRAWTGLEIVATTGGSLLAKDGTVEFRARYRNPTGPGVQHENSRFVRENGRWVYLDAVS